MEKVTEKQIKAPRKKAALTEKFSFLKKMNKKNIQIAAAALLIVVILLIYFTSITSKNKSNNKDSVVSAADYCEKMQSDLEGFLSQINGAGKVKVLINFTGTTELVIAYITNSNTQKNVADGGKYTENTQESSSPVVLSQGGSQVPLIIKQIYPEVTGVIVGAEGAGDVKIKLALIDAVRTFLKINADSVQVYALKK